MKTATEITLNDWKETARFGIVMNIGILASAILTYLVDFESVYIAGVFNLSLWIGLLGFIGWYFDREAKKIIRHAEFEKLLGK